MTRLWRRRPAATSVTASPAASAETPRIGRLSGSLLAVLEHVEEAILLIGPDRVVRWANPPARRMFATIAEPHGRLLVEVVREHRLDSLAQRALETRLEQSLEVELAGAGRTLMVRAVPISAAEVAIVAHDVTRLRHLETVRQQFVANLSHEMRTPLAGLDLAAQTLAGQTGLAGDARDFVEAIGREAQRLTDILKNLNQLAALDADSIQVERQPFEISQLLDDLVERYQTRAAAAGLAVRAEPMSRDVRALGDRAKTEQALQSVVDNALKFTSAGEVVIAASSEPTRIEITVRDTGPGIPARDLPRIFERFYKVDRSRDPKTPGSGLGLSIARHLVELQGGTVLADSVPGTGTIMRIRLPRQP